MEILNFDSNGSNRSPKKRGRLVTIVGGAFLFAAVGSTFAANITINTDNAIEYAQGITQAAACNPSLLIIPTNKFVNTSGSGAFFLETLTVQDSAAVTTAVGVGLGNCDGKTLRLAAYGDTGAALNLSGTGSTTFCDVAIAAYDSNLVQATNPDATKCVATVVKQQKGFALVFTGGSPLAAASIHKITLESF